MKLNNKNQLSLFKINSKIKFNLIDNEINEIVDGKITYNSPDKEEIFINCKYGEYQYDYKELNEVLR